MRRRDWALLVLLSLLWGCSFLFVEVALRGMPVFTVALGRTAIAALVLLAFLAAVREPLAPLARRWREFLLLGALRGAIPISLIVWAQTRIDSGVAGILNSTSPLFTMVIAHGLTQEERLTARKLAGCLIGMAGVTVMMGMDALRGLGDTALLGHLAMLGATCSYGFAAVYGRRFHEGSHAASAAGMLTGAALLVLPAALLLERPWTVEPGLQPLAALCALAVVSTALAFVVWFQLITRVGASRTSLVTFLIPFSALGLGVALLGEKPSASALGGLALILAGLAVIQYQPRR